MSNCEATKHEWRYYWEGGTRYRECLIDGCNAKQKKIAWNRWETVY